MIVILARSNHTRAHYINSHRNHDRCSFAERNNGRKMLLEGHPNWDIHCRSCSHTFDSVTRPSPSSSISTGLLLHLKLLITLTKTYRPFGTAATAVKTNLRLKSLLG